MYFFNRRPRGFRYTMRFSNERRDLLDDLRRGVPPEVLVERSLSESSPTDGSAYSRRRGAFVVSRWLFLAAVMLLLAFLVAILLA